MNSNESLTPQQAQLEISRLGNELQMRDRLIQQLSQELFRLVKGNTDFTPAVEVSERQQAETRALRQQLESVEEQVKFYQEEITRREAENYQLRQSVQELTDRTATLEQVVQDLPEIYRKKFADRLAPVKEQLELLQKENRRLHTELQSVTYRLAMRSRTTTNLDLPNFQNEHSDKNGNLHSFGNI